MQTKKLFVIFMLLLLANNLEAQELAGDVFCENNSGFYKIRFNTKITTTETNETVKYTLDGSDPRYSENSITNTTPFEVNIDPQNITGRDKTPAVIFRASVFKNNFLPSKPISRTYIFLSEVKKQTEPGGQWPLHESKINTQVIDLEMDRYISYSSRYKPEIEAALLDIPTISLITDMDNLFNSQTGIYVNAEYHGNDWEKPVNVELINPDGSKGFNIDAGLRIRGGWSRHGGSPKHAFRLFFRSDYGNKKLKFPLFEDEGVDEFDKLDLRASQNYAWNNNADAGRLNTLNRDVFSRDCQKDMGKPYMRSRYYHLYLNGMYWGIYQSQERGEANYAASYFGGDKEDYDVIKVDIGDLWDIYDVEATDGNLDAWLEIWNMCQEGFASNKNYFKIQGLNTKGEPDVGYKTLVDIENLIDYMLVIFYTGNIDAPVSKFSGNGNPNNFYGIYDRTNTREGFKFLIHDAEHTLLTEAIWPGIGILENRVNIGTSEIRMNVRDFEKFQPQWLHYKLSENKEYRVKFADRAYRHLFNYGALTTEKCEKRFMATANQLNLAIIAESARWGDAQTSDARTKDDDWLPAVNNIIEDYFPQRTDIVLYQLTDENLYPTIKAPLFENNERKILDLEIPFSDNYKLLIKNPSKNGTVIYTTDGTDPRTIGSNISTTAIDAGIQTEITVNTSINIKARIKSGDNWSALHEIFFTDPNVFSYLKVTEINYNPKDNGNISGKNLEFIEFKNTGNQTIDLSNLTFSNGIKFSFPAGSVLEANEFTVIASNSTAFADFYGFSPNYQYSGYLSNSGEIIEIETASMETVLSFKYSDNDPWPQTADGDGYSLISVQTNPTKNPSDYDYWIASSELSGSPNTNDLLSNIKPILSKKPTMSFVNIYPNPTNSLLNIEFVLDKAESVEINLFDLNGRLVSQLSNDYLPAGIQNISTDLENLNINSGIFFIRYKSESTVISQKLIYNK